MPIGTGLPPGLVSGIAGAIGGGGAAADEAEEGAGLANALPSGVEKSIDKYMNGSFTFGTNPTSGEMMVMNSSGQVVYSLDPSRFGGIEDALEEKMSEVNGNVGRDEDGNFYIDAGPKGARNPAPTGFRSSGTNSTGNPTGGGQRARTGGDPSTGGDPAAGGAGTRPIGGGGQEFRPPQESGNPFANPPPIGGGEAGIDPNAEIGINDPGKNPIGLGDFFDNSRGDLGGGNSIFDSLPDNPTLKDILGAVQRGNEDSRDAQLDIQAGLFDESLNSDQSQGQRANLDHILANPESMDEGMIQQILGKQNQAIGSRASQLGQLAQDSAASRGVGRDVGQREQSRILREGAHQQSEAERTTRIDAAKTNFQDRLNTLGAAGGEINRDQGARRDIGNTATGVLASTQDRGTNFLTNALLSSPDTPKIAGANTVKYSAQR